jgi:hypothetical protein
VTTGKCGHCHMHWKVALPLNALRSHPSPSGGQCVGSATVPAEGTLVTR